jgi:hypothetical protein
VALISIVVLALAASATSITNLFAFDDRHIVATNAAVHSLERWWTLFAQSYWPSSMGGDLYRPFTMLGFAVQWVAGGGNPVVFHAVNIVLYALVCAAFFRVTVGLLPLAGAWLASALFAVHPVHVEAVGNVVGQSELWAALFMFVALRVFLRARENGALSGRDVSLIVVCYALALLSKEHAIVLPLVLIAAELTVTPRPRPLRARLVELRLPLLAMAAVGLVFVWVRTAIIAASRGMPPEPSLLFVGQPYGLRLLTMLRVMLEWLRLLFWPAELSADYSPRHIDLVTGPTLEVMLSAVIVAAVIGIAWVARRSYPIATFAILWLGIALMIPSNLIVLTGFVLAERTLFVATAPAMLAVAFVVMRIMPPLPALSPVARRLVGSAVAALLLVGVIASAMRQRVWHDNASLFEQTVRDAPTSSNARLYYATTLFEQGKFREAFDELGLAHRLYPKNLAVLELAGEQYSRARTCSVAIRLFRQVLATDYSRMRSRTGLASCYITTGDHANARKTIREGLGVGQPENALRQLLRINDSVETAARLKRPGNRGASD